MCVGIVWGYIKISIYKLFTIFRTTFHSPPSVLVHHLLLSWHSGSKVEGVRVLRKYKWL